MIDRSVIEELRADTIAKYEAKINELRVKMEKMLLVLSEVDKIVASAQGKVAIEKKAALDQRVFKSKPPETKRSVYDRLKDAAESINGNFGRKELQEKAGRDDTGTPIAEGTFSVIFPRLIKAGKIVEVQKAVGNKPGLYKSVKGTSDTEPRGEK
ncbi:MAG: hypothetical protein ACLP9S_18565 [Syntrophales bacterium]